MRRWQARNAQAIRDGTYSGRAHDGVCDDGGSQFLDGGVGAEYNGCYFGTDCSDCGDRSGSLDAYLLVAETSWDPSRMLYCMDDSPGRMGWQQVRLIALDCT